MVVVTAVVSGVALISCNTFNSIFCVGISIVVSVSGVSSDFGGSSLAHHSHPYQYNKHHQHHHHKKPKHHLHHTAYT